MATVLEQMRAEQEERRRKADEAIAAQEQKLGLDLTPNKTYSTAASKLLSEIPEDELDTDSRGILSQMVKGRLANTTPNETFDDYFKRTVRPATEFLQDFTRGFLASGTGRAAVTTRDQSYKEYVDLQKMRMEQQQQEDTRRNQLAITARSLVNAQKSARVRALTTAIQGEKNEQNRLRYSQELQVELGLKTREEARQESILDQKNREFAHKVEQDKRFKNSTADSAKDLAMIQIKSTIPDFPDDLQALNPEQAKIFEQEFNKAYKTLNPEKKGGTGGSPSFRYIPIENGYGGQDMYVFDSKNPENSYNPVTKDPLFPAVKLSDEQKKGRDAAMSYFGTAGVVIHAIQQATKNPIGPERLIPEGALQAFGMLGFDARQVERGYKQMILEAQRAITGAQATDAERGFIKGLFAAPYGSDPKLFANDLAFSATVGKLTALRTAGGLLERLDLSDVMKQLYDYYSEQTKNGRYGEVLSDEKLQRLIDEAAADQGKKVIRDAHGRIRDMAPLESE